MIFPSRNVGSVLHLSVFLAVASFVVKAPMKLIEFIGCKLSTGESATFLRAKLMFSAPSFLSQTPTSPISVINTNLSLTTISCRNLK